MFYISAVMGVWFPAAVLTLPGLHVRTNSGSCGVKYLQCSIRIEPNTSVAMGSYGQNPEVSAKLRMTPPAGLCS